MSDIEAADAAYRERLALAASLGEPGLLADAHYDIGFIDMMRADGDALRRHEEEALRLYAAAGDEAGVIRARQALVLGVFLTGDYVRARDLEEENLDAFRATGSRNEIADSLTFLTGVHFKLGHPEEAWPRLLEALGMFADTNNASGLARSLGIAAILLDRYGDRELAARITGAAYELVRLHGVMMAPVMVLHLPDPRELATEHLGRERAEKLIAAGAATPVADIVAELRALPVPTDPARVAPATGGA
jgi:tetratricopeptide (TPR) repeat protein